MSKIRKTAIERFEDLFVPEPMSGCWLWVGGDSMNRTLHGAQAESLGATAKNASGFNLPGTERGLSMCERCEELESKLKASQERELALREALGNAKPARTSDQWHVWINYPTEPSIGLGEYIEEVLSRTSTTAQQTVERIKKETREAVWSAVKDMWGASPMQFRAAILGERNP